MTNEATWRFLVVDDKQANEVIDFIKGNRVLTPDRVIFEVCEDFSKAIDILGESRIDLIILDLKDDSIDLEDEANPFAGEKVFDQVRRYRFVPIIFHTAYAHKVGEMKSPFVQVVSRDDPQQLRTAIKTIFETGLPQLIRHLEAEQREYMWDHMQNHWQNYDTNRDKTDLTYLLARRLANTLERNSIRRFLAGQDAGSQLEDDDTIHPVEMYIYPPTSPKILSGDILRGDFNGRDGYWLVMTPSCDLVQDKVTHVVLAACFPLVDQPEFRKVRESREREEPPSNSAKKDLVALIGNNRNAKHEGRRFQPERYSFLPGTFFLPDLVVDYQSLVQIPLEKLEEDNRITSLDSPFAEAFSARFARYFGRMGTPDIDREFVYSRILESI